jgi:hypothetical protein
MIDEIAALEKKTNKNNPNSNNIKLLNRANFVSACLVQLSNKTCQEDFSSLNAMHEHMKKIDKKKIKKKKCKQK